MNLMKKIRDMQCLSSPWYTQKEAELLKRAGRDVLRGAEDCELVKLGKKESDLNVLYSRRNMVSTDGMWEKLF